MTYLPPLTGAAAAAAAAPLPIGEQEEAGTDWAHETSILRASFTAAKEYSDNLKEAEILYGFFSKCVAAGLESASEVELDRQMGPENSAFFRGLLADSTPRLFLWAMALAPDPDYEELRIFEAYDALIYIFHVKTNTQNQTFIQVLQEILDSDPPENEDACAFFIIGIAKALFDLGRYQNSLTQLRRGLDYHISPRFIPYFYFTGLLEVACLVALKKTDELVRTISVYDYIDPKKTHRKYYYSILKPILSEKRDTPSSPSVIDEEPPFRKFEFLWRLKPGIDARCATPPLKKRETRLKEKIEYPYWLVFSPDNNHSAPKAAILKTDEALAELTRYALENTSKNVHLAIERDQSAAGAAAAGESS